MTQSRNNELDFDHDGASEIAEGQPLLSTFRFVESNGKTRYWKQSERKELTSESNLKGVGQLMEAKQFMEALGPDVPNASASSTQVTLTRAIRGLQQSPMQVKESIFSANNLMDFAH